MVHKLKCKACTEFVDRIRGSRNFSDKWIVGADSVRLSNVRDHAQNNQHLRAMSLLRKRCAESAGLDVVLAKLLLSLPASNGKLERTFSLVGTIKNDKRSRLTNQSLDDLLLVLSNKVPLQNFNPDESIDRWWSAKRRRLSQRERKQYKPHGIDRPSTSARVHDQSSESEPEDMLEYWDELMNSEVDSDSD